MARSSLIIGLGGTGQWIVTYLKKDLLESNNGVLPDNVRLLSFDTMLEQEAKVAQMGDEEDIKVGDVQLDFGTEFIPLADDVYDLATQVKDGKHPQIASWFAAKRWIGALPRANFILKTGAGQLRQFGRTAIFSDLSRGTSNSVIWRALVNALGSIGSVAGQHPIEVFVIGSFAGGTGSGMFIDMGWLVRQAARSQSATLRGYFVLPGAFTSQGGDSAMQARTFAAWRELNRYMTLNDEEGLPKLIFDNKDKDLQVDLGKRVYDACYLVDGIRGSATIAEDPKKSIYPSVSDAISAVLDDKGGSRYTDYVLQNLGPRYLDRRGKPMYSTLSTYSYKVPIYYLRQEYAHAFGKQFLETLLGVIPSPSDGTLIINSTNPGQGSQSGFDASSELFNQESQRFGVGGEEQVAYSNLFLQKISSLAAAGGIRNAQLLEDQVQAFLSRVGLDNSWVKPFTSFGDDPVATQLKGEVNDAVQFQLKSVIDITPRQTSGGFWGYGKESPDEIIRRIKPRVESYMWDYYGGQVATGGEFTGKLGDALDQVQGYQVNNFENLLRIWLKRTLMGESQTDFVQARGGKIGYALSFIEGIIHQFETVITFLGQVQSRVAQQKPTLMLQERKSSQEAKMARDADKKMMWWSHPNAYNNIEKYRRSAQDVAYSRREAITHQAVVETVERMQQYAVVVKDELQRWVHVLFDGNSSLGLSGLYDQIQRSLNSVQATHKADQSLSEAHTLLLDTVPPISDALLQDMMRGVVWDVDIQNGTFDLSLHVQPEGDRSLSFQKLGIRSTKSSAKMLSEKNLGELLGMGVERYPSSHGADQQLSAVLQLHENDPAALADNLFDGYNQTLIKQYSGEDGPIMRSNFIRVAKGNTPESVDYFDTLTKRLRERSLTSDNKRDTTFPVEVVDSANDFKLTMVRTDDLWSHEAFSSWHACFEAYKKEIVRPNQSPVQYHIYPPEIRAVDYELKLRDLRLDYRAFHPRVVHLLEYSNRVEQFFLGWALGFFQRMEEGINAAWWELVVPGSRYPVQITDRWRREPEDFIFALMNSYVLHGRDLTLGVSSRVNYGEVQNAIKDARDSLGRAGMLEKIRHQLTHANGLMAMLTTGAKVEQVYDESIESLNDDLQEVVNHPEFFDLRDLGRLIYQDELRALGYELLDVEEDRI